MLSKVFFNFSASSFDMFSFNNFGADSTNFFAYVKWTYQRQSNCIQKFKTYIHEGQVWYKGLHFSDDFWLGSSVEGFQHEVKDRLFLRLFLLARFILVCHILCQKVRESNSNRFVLLWGSGSSRGGSGGRHGNFLNI